MLENLPITYEVGRIHAGPGAVTYSIRAQPTGDHFTISNTGVIKTTKVWDYETATDRGPHSLTVTATRTSDSTTDITQVSIELANQLEPSETLTAPTDIPGITWTLIPKTNFVMAKLGNTRKPAYELNIQIKCVNNYYSGRNFYSGWLRIWQDGTVLSYPKQVPTETQPFPGNRNPLLQPDLWQAHDLKNPRPEGISRPGSNCSPEYTDIWNDADTLYAMDATNRLIKAHDLTHRGIIITRNPAKDIPVTDDHYRGFWKIRGIWADADTVWVTAAETSVSSGFRSAAYSRSTFRRDSTKDYTASPHLDLSPDHNGRTRTYLPADMWKGSNNLWFLHTQYRNAAGAVDPAQTSPTALKTCTADDASTPTIQVLLDLQQVNTPLRITGIDTTNRVYILSHETQELVTIDTSLCPPELVASEYNYQEIPNKPQHPVYTNHVQTPTGISTHQDTPFMYFVFATGEILRISKILPSLEDTTVMFPEHSPGSTIVGPRFDPRTTTIDQGPYTWEVAGTDQTSFDHQTSGDESQYLQILTKDGVDYDYEAQPTKTSYEITLSVTDIDSPADTDSADITLDLINLNEPATGDISINGDAHVGKILTPSHENVEDPDGLPQDPIPTYQWLRNGLPISGGTTKTRTLIQADYNNFITVRITYTDNAGFENHFTPRPTRVTYIPVTASLSQGQITLEEGDTTTVLTVDLSETPHREVTLTLDVTPGANLEATEYTVSPTNVTFAASEITKTITITAPEDRVDEDDERLTIQIAELPTQVTLGATYNTDLTITDDDTAAVNTTAIALEIQEGSTGSYSIDLDSQPTEDVTITLSLPANPELALSETTLTFTDQTWNIQQEVTVTPAQDDDAIHEPDRQITYAITSEDPKYDPIEVDDLTIKVTDNDPAGITLSTTALTIEEGQSKTYTIWLDTEPSADVTITINDPSNTDITGEPDSYTFNPTDWFTPKTITVNTVDDDDAPDDSGTITHTVTTTATEYLTTVPDQHPYPAVSVDDIPVTVTDPDEPEILFSETSVTMVESTTATYTVKLATEPTQSVTISISGNVDTPLALNKTSLTFTSTDWDDTQTVTLTAADDRDAVVPGNITLGHLADGGDYGGEAKSLVVSINETDEEGVTITPSTLSMEENATKEYTIVLTSQPLEDVDITLSISENSEIKTTQTFEVPNQDPNEPPTREERAISKVTFTGENWDTPQTVKVTALDDEDAVDESPAVISHSPDTTDILYQDLTNLDSITVSVTDDEPEVSVSFGAAAYETTEGSAAATVTVTLSEDPNRQVPITFTAAPITGTGATNADYTLSDTTVTFQKTETSKTFTVTATNDTVDDDRESVTLTLSASLPPRVTAGTTTRTVVALIDDDHPILTIKLDPPTKDVEEKTSQVIKATLSALPERQISILITKANGTGAKDSDHSGIPSTLTFAADDTEQSFTLTATDDVDYEPDETVTIGFGIIPAAERITPAPPTTSVITIKDNDNSFLSDLTANHGTFNTAFLKTTETYTITTAYPKNQITLSTSTDDSRATVQFLDASDDALTDSGSDAKTLTNTPLAIGDNTIKIKVTSPSGQATTTYSLTIQRAKPTVSIAISPPSITEGTNAVFTITRSASAPDTLSVTVNIEETVDDSKIATANEKEHEVTVAANNGSATLTIPTISDMAWELHSIVTASLKTETHYTLHTTQGDTVLTILDDDLPPLDVTWDAASKNRIAEDAGPLSLITTVLTDDDKQPHAPFNLTISHTEGTGDTGATEPEDYNAPPSTTVAIPTTAYTRVDIDDAPDQEDHRYRATATLFFPIVNDTNLEEHESFEIDISKKSSDPAHIRNAVDDQAAETLITIIDDERIKVATLESLTVTGQSNSVITLNPPFDKTNVSYTAAPAHLHHQVTIRYDTTIDEATGEIQPPDDDTILTGHQINLTPGTQTTVTVKVTAEDGTTIKTYTVQITRAKAVVSITPGHTTRTEGQDAVFTITRSSTAADALTLNINVSETQDLVATTNEGNKTVTIAANTTSVKHTVPTKTNTIWDPHSAVTAALTAGPAHTLHDSAHTASINVNDDDFPASTATLMVSPNPIEEDGGNVTVTLKVVTNADQQPHADAGDITIKTSNATAVAGTDYTALDTTQPVAQTAFTSVNSKYEASYTHTVPITDDTIDDEDETFNIDMAKAPGASPHLSLTPPTHHIIAITDNDKSIDPTLSDLVITEFTESGDEINLSAHFVPSTGTYTATATYDVTRVIVTPTTNNLYATAVITPVDSVTDDADEDTQGHQVNISVGSNTITVTVAAEDNTYTKAYTVTLTRSKPTVTVTQTAPTDLTEGDTAKFTISRTPASSETLGVDLTVTGPTTMADSSDIGDKTVSIAANQTSATLNVDTTADTAWEAHATVNAQLNAKAAAYTIGDPSSATHTVKDDDFPAATAKVTAPLTAVESAGVIRATLTITTTGDTEPHAATGPINLTTSNGTATAGADYQSRTGTLSFDAADFASQTDGASNTTWTASKEWDLTIINDTDAEEAENETFHVTISTVATTQGTVGTQQNLTMPAPGNKATITIVDDDKSAQANATALTVKVTGTTTPINLSPDFSAANTGPYTGTVGYQVNSVTVLATPESNKAIVSYNGVTPTIPADGAPITLIPGLNVITVKIQPEAGTAKNYTVQVTRTKPIVTISALATNITEGQNISISVSRNGGAPDSLDVKVALSETGDVLAASLEATHTLTIAAGSTSITSTQIFATTDDTVWEHHSTVTAALQTGANYTDAATSAVDVNVMDNDTPSIALSEDLDLFVIHEATGKSIITITALTAGATQPHGPDFNVTYTKAGSGTNPTTQTDYNTTPATVSFTNSDFQAQTTTETDPETNLPTQVTTAYKAVKTLTVTPVNDSINEPNESLAITLTRAFNTHANITTADLGTHEITITDNEAGLKAIAITGTTITSTVTQGTTSYTASAPYNVTQVTTTATTQFPDETWKVTSPATDANIPIDSSDDGHQTNLGPEDVTGIIITATAEDATATKDYTVTITRQPTVVSITADEDEITEGAAAVFTLTRIPSSSQDTGLTIEVEETGDAVDNPPASFTIPANETSAKLSIPTDNDSTYESNSDVTVTIKDANGYNPATTPANTATVTVKDNDPPTGTATTFASGQNLTVDEDDGTVNISITVNTGSDRTNAAVTVDLAATGGSGTNAATSTGDYTAADATLTFNPTDFARDDDQSPWKATKTWPITITNDDDDEDTETFTVEADPNTGSAPTDLTVRIRDNEVGLNTLTLTDPATDLDQTVAAATKEYTASTPSGTTSVQINATATHSGTTGVDGDNPRPLLTGDNDISIDAIAEDTTTKVPYTLRVRRLSPDATLKSLALTNATPGEDPDTISITPPLAADVTGYTATVTSAVTHVALTAATNHPNANAKFLIGTADIADLTSFELASRDTIISIPVTPEDATTPKKTYTLTITRQSGSATLTSLTVTPLEAPGLTPAFTSLTTGYAGTALNNTEEVTVTATAASTQADVSFPPSTTKTKGTATAAIDLVNGDNNITIQVSSEDSAETNTYTVTVTRLGPFVTITADDDEITEGDTASFTLTRTGNLPGTQDIPVDIALNHAAPTETAAAFEGVETTTTITRDTTSNTIWNATATLNAEIKDGDGHQRTTPYTAQVSVLDNDYPDTEIVMTIDPLQVSEALGKTTITVTATTARNEKPNDFQNSQGRRQPTAPPPPAKRLHRRHRGTSTSSPPISPTSGTQYKATKTVEIPVTDDDNVEPTQ